MFRRWVKSHPLLVGKNLRISGQILVIKRYLCMHGCDKCFVTCKYLSWTNNKILVQTIRYGKNRGAHFHRFCYSKLSLTGWKYWRIKCLVKIGENDFQYLFYKEKVFERREKKLKICLNWIKDGPEVKREQRREMHWIPCGG